MSSILFLMKNIVVEIIEKVGRKLSRVSVFTDELSVVTDFSSESSDIVLQKNIETSITSQVTDEEVASENVNTMSMMTESDLKIVTHLNEEECIKLINYNFVKISDATDAIKIANDQAVDSNNCKDILPVCLLLFKELSKEEPDLDFLSVTIKQDFILTLKLKKIVNSPVFCSRRPKSSIKECIMYLGIKKLKRIVLITMVMEVGSEVSKEVAKMSVLRGCLSEKLSIYSKKNNQTEECFIMGVLSLTDVLLKRNIADALENFPVSDLVYDALVSSEGELVDILCIVKAYERGLWEEIDSLCNKLGIDQNSISKIYFEAVSEAEKIYGMVSNSSLVF